MVAGQHTTLDVGQLPYYNTVFGWRRVSNMLAMANSDGEQLQLS